MNANVMNRIVVVRLSIMRVVNGGGRSCSEKGNTDENIRAMVML